MNTHFICSCFEQASSLKLYSIFWLHCIVGGGRGEGKDMRASHKISEKETEGLLIAIRVVTTNLPHGKQAEAGTSLSAISWSLSLVSSPCEVSQDVSEIFWDCVCCVCMRVSAWFMSAVVQGGHFLRCPLLSPESHFWNSAIMLLYFYCKHKIYIRTLMKNKPY